MYNASGSLIRLRIQSQDKPFDKRSTSQVEDIEKITRDMTLHYIKELTSCKELGPSQWICLGGPLLGFEGSPLGKPVRSWLQHLFIPAPVVILPPQTRFSDSSSEVPGNIPLFGCVFLYSETAGCQRSNDESFLSHLKALEA